jgi:DNA-binding NtrC family response regulator
MFTNYKEWVHKSKKEYIEKILEHTGGNATVASKIAQIDPTVLSVLIRKFKVDRKEIVKRHRANLLKEGTHGQH